MISPESIQSIIQGANDELVRLANENKKLKDENEELKDENEKLKDRVQEVIDIQTTFDQDCFVLWWTGRNGDEHKLEFKLIQNPMDETMCREVHIYDPTRS